MSNYGKQLRRRLAALLFQWLPIWFSSLKNDHLSPTNPLEFS